MSLIEIIEFGNPANLTEQALRKRAAQSKVTRSRQFFALVNGVEAGYLSFDARSDLKIGILYDLLVLPPFRNLGVGGALIEKGENLAVSLGYERVRVLPKAFDNSVDQGWLEIWYRKHGYLPSSDGTHEYQKQLAAK